MRPALRPSLRPRRAGTPCQPRGIPERARDPGTQSTGKATPPRPTRPCRERVRGAQRAPPLPECSAARRSARRGPPGAEGSFPASHPRGSEHQPGFGQVSPWHCGPRVELGVEIKTFAIRPSEERNGIRWCFLRK